MKFRYNASIAIAGLVAFLGAVPLATSGFSVRDGAAPWYAYPLLVILIVPVAVIVWGWRSGTNADAEGLLVRPFGFGGRRLAWSDVAGIVPQGRRVYAVTTSEQAIALPAVTRADIPRLIAASGQTVDQPEPADLP